MQVRLGVLGEVKIDHHIDRLDVNASGEEICNDRKEQSSAVMQINHEKKMADGLSVGIGNQP